MDFIQELTEQADARHKAMKLFRQMDKYYEVLENMHDDLDGGRTGKAMAAQGFGHGELADLKKNIAAVLEVFSDFMPGLEMEMRGE